MVNYRYFLDITHNKAATTINYCVRKPGLWLKIDSWERSILTLFQFFLQKSFELMQTVMNLAQINLLFIQMHSKTRYEMCQPTYHIKQAVRFIMRWSGLHCIQVNTDGFLVLKKSRSQVHVFDSLITCPHEVDQCGSEFSESTSQNP